MRFQFFAAVLAASVSAASLNSVYNYETEIVDDIDLNEYDNLYLAEKGFNEDLADIREALKKRAEEGQYKNEKADAAEDEAKELEALTHKMLQDGDDLAKPKK